MDSVLGFILGGGRGAGLYPLTRLRSTPAVPVAGMYRLIDIPISNCINSEVRRIFVLTQFLSVSLHRHINSTYKFAPFRRGFVEVLAAQQTNEAADWYRGTADALRQNMRYLNDDQARDVLILSADGLYRMDYRELIRTHRDSEADLTMAVVPVPAQRASNLGIVQVDAKERLTGLIEKPRTPQQLDAFRMTSGNQYLANMGVYVIRRQVLLELLTAQPDAVDLVTQHFARILGTHRVQAHLFKSYWQDLGGSIGAYHEANLALATDNPPFNFFCPQGVMYTRMRNLPASRIRSSDLTESLVSDGCVIEEGARLERCVVGQRTRIGRNVHLRDTVICGADRFQSEAPPMPDAPPIGIGAGSIIHKAILDKDCRIGRDVRIVNQAGLSEGEGDCWVIRDGIVVIPKGAIVPDGTVI